MTSYRCQLEAVQITLWHEGCEDSPELTGVLAALKDTPLPHGVARLSAANLTPGPHLERQIPHSSAMDRHVIVFQRKATTLAATPAQAKAPSRV